MTRAARIAVFSRGSIRLIGAATLLAGLLACEDPAKPTRESTTASSGSELAVRASADSTAPGAVASSAPTNAAAPGAYHGGDKERGRQVIEAFECTRCHSIPSFRPAARDKNCVSCHDDISRGAFPAPADAVHRWQKTVEPYVVNPSLASVGPRFKREWVYRFLLDPRDLRPHLATSMPKLALSEQQAADVVAYLTDDLRGPETDPPLPSGSASRGRELMEQKACTSCHAFTGVPPFATVPDPKPSDERLKRAVRLAPDLRFTRERFRVETISAWLREPTDIKTDTLMPTHGLDAKDAEDIATYVYTAELDLPPPPPMPARLPVLERRVEFQEVMDKVFGVTCRHCHSDPDASLGDGGPGNTGGFGFAPKGLDLATYRGVAAGYLDAKGERSSVFLPLEDGTPRLLAVLLARQMEERGQRRSDVRGMPLGLPALTQEQIQLVESWIAQGRPR